MADTLSSLTSALADRYRIERELGPTTSSFDEDKASFTSNGQTMVFERSRSLRPVAIADLNKLLEGARK